VKRTLLSAIGSLFLGLFFFLLIAPLNQSLAVGSGGSCRVSVKQGMEIKCDAGLTCDTSSDQSAECTSDVTCRGVCVAAPVICSIHDGGPVNGGCKTNEYCNVTNPTSEGRGSGTCVPNSAPHVAQGGTCISSSSFGGANAAQGNCLSGLVCNTAADKSCSSTSGGCTGECFPVNYSCDVTNDSRTNVTQYKCPGNFSCYEAQNKKPTQVCTTTSCSKGGCATSCTMQCPGCIFSCVPSVDAKITCKCDNRPDSAANVGPQKNGFTCANAITSQHSFCESRQGCYDDDPNATMNQSQTFNGLPLNGIQCLTPDQKHPPAPPCLKYEYPGGIQGDPDNHGKCLEIATSFGAVGTDPGSFITRLFGILLGASGAIALLLIMRAGYRIMSSRGNPEGIQQGREQLVAAIVGLIFLIFSFVLLQVIGVDILKLPGNTGGTIPQGGTCDVNNPKCAPGLTCNYNGAQGQCQ